MIATTPLLIILDAAVFVLTWLVSWTLRWSLEGVLGFPINPLSGYLEALVILLPAWLLACQLFGLDAPQRSLHFVQRYKVLLRRTFLAVVVIIAVDFFVPRYELGRSVVLFFALLHLPVCMATRDVVSTLLGTRRRVRTLIVGTGEPATRLLQRLEDLYGALVEVRGFVATQPGSDTCCNHPVLGLLPELADIIDRHRIDMACIALPQLGRDEQFTLVEAVLDRPITIKLLTDSYSVMTSSFELEMLGELPLVTLENRQRGRFREWVKMLVDRSVALGFLALLWPLLLCIGLAIVLDSRGKVILRQLRIGKDGKPFHLYKFRTMVADTDLYAVSPHTPEDRRITPLGKHLRRYSLDELPQFLNVLLGHMSLVGPRPEMPFIVEGYRGWERLRLRVRPGITGLWQILGRKDLPLHEHLEYDLYYVMNHTLLLDAIILLKTVPALILRKGAY